jgi:hypothetical protein
MSSSTEPTQESSNHRPSWEVFVGDIEGLRRYDQDVLHNEAHWTPDVFEALLHQFSEVVAEPGWSEVAASVLNELPFSQPELTWLQAIQNEVEDDATAFHEAVVNQGGEANLAARLRAWLIGEPGGPYEGHAANFIKGLRMEQFGDREHIEPRS